MKLAIMQPYFLPYIGYFQLINAVDKFVVYDDVNYIKGGWINRNNILESNSKRLFTITLKRASQNKLINEIEIGDDFNKFLKTIRTNYSKSPFFNDVFFLLEKVVSFENRCLSEFIANSINEILYYLKINTTILFSSQLSKNISLKGKDKVVNICKILGGNTYVNTIGGIGLYDKAEFARNGLELLFLEPISVPYKQFNNEFIPNLSILDVMMFNSVQEISKMIQNYKLI